MAIKVLPAEFARDPDRVARFEREATILASLNHPNIAHIHGIEETDGILALVMEFVRGDTLAGRRLTLDEALKVAHQIAAALEAAHEQGIVHRDLKPAKGWSRRTEWSSSRLRIGELEPTELERFGIGADELDDPVTDGGRAQGMSRTGPI